MADAPGPPRIQPHLCVKDGLAAIAFYEQAFGATCAFKQLAEDGKRVFVATLGMFGSEIMLNDEFPEFGPDVRAPSTLGAASLTINIHMDRPADVDAAVERARKAGAVITFEPGDVPWGARHAKLRDPFGHAWSFNAPSFVT